MKETFRVRAPGKLILCGEYAVLKGTPCLCAGVARYAYATVTPAPSFQLSALGQGPFAVQRNGGVITLSPAPTDPARFELVRQVLLRAPALPPVHMALDSSELAGASLDGQGTIKLGLGSSASTAVALTAALRLVSVDAPAQRTWFEEAQRAHLAMQGGLGSGVDVAAASVGGLFVYTRPDADPAHAQISPISRTDLGLVPVVVWTGMSASTVNLVARVEALERAQPALAAQRFAQLDAVARRAAEAGRAGDGRTLLEAVHAYGAQMEALGVDAGVDIVTREHRTVRQLAEKHGCGGKPSGAGGGDIAVVLAPDGSRARAFSEEVAAAGYPVVPLPWDFQGASLV